MESRWEMRAEDPLLLSIESATRVMSVAVLEGETLLAEISTFDDRVHSERLLPAIDQLLRIADLRLDEIEAFAISIGPGSFTGLRIGLATLKGLALGSDRPVVAVPTLAALTVAGAGAVGPVAALLDARRDEVYAACFERSGDVGPPLIPDAVFSAEDLAAALPRPCTVVVGEGTEGVASAAAERARDGMALLPAALGQARAFHVGLLGARLLAGGEAQRSEDLVPRYVRRAEAEVRRTGQRFEEPAR
jgi:tRNA threonylcarbamoyladenosine biosynthesis protein TsaB